MPSFGRDLPAVLYRRRDCLRTIHSEPRGKRELVDALDTPRSTLDDVVRELEEFELVEYSDGVWRATVLGSCAVEVLDDYCRRLETLTDSTSVVSKLPSDTSLGCELLVGASTHQTDRAVPDEVVQVLLESVADATLVRGVAPVALAGHAFPFYERATTGDGAQLELVADDHVLDRLEEMYPKRMAAATADESLSLYRGPVGIPFGLWIADQSHVGVVVYGERSVEGVIENDTADALEWAERQFEDARTDATLVATEETGRQ
ncbi:helix-turn-helix transcriptional regulator [Halomarina oriensis]|uniref:ArsR family transcriptional regulator n=1 Tax=Halomarina oriensis TaxID=671145 RepID=A0A6B0GJI9_9EURY|nr:hypothetical protein [Halomarina oriensis]MWG33559.1 hypothetical protein [Halomarina oriensis]